MRSATYEKVSARKSMHGPGFDISPKYDVTGILINQLAGVDNIHKRAALDSEFLRLLSQNSCPGIVVSAVGMLNEAQLPFHHLGRLSPRIFVRFWKEE